MEKPESYIAWDGGSWRLRINPIPVPGSHQVVEKGIVEHPGSVVLVPLIAPETVLMLRQYRLALNQKILELPAGTRHWHEDWIACAQRELREETGFRAETLTFLGEIWPAPGVTDEIMKIYMAEGLTPDPLPADFDEAIEVQPMALPLLWAQAQDGRIKDAKTIIALQKVALHRQSTTTS